MVDRHLYIFNLEINLDSPVLASAHDWVEEFSKHYSKVFVYTTHAGRFNLPQNVRVIETGGGSFRKRVLSITKLLTCLISIYKNRKKTDVFHHMSSKTLLLLGIPIKVMKIPQIIWYSHSVADFALKCGARFASLVVSATKQSIPELPGIISRPLGHGISLPRMGNVPESVYENREGIISVGRVVSIKNIELAIYAISTLDKDLRKKINCLGLVGPYEDGSAYLRFLHQQSQKHQVEILTIGPVTYERIPDYFRRTSIVFTGTPKSADKAALEAAMLGCLILTTNKSVQELTGMERVLPNDELSRDLSKQLAWMLSLAEKDLAEVRKEVARISRELNSLENLVIRLVKCFEDIRSPEITDV
jgi:glycosyltransferase involved in cell wall biosynthesis